jgi:hypothetical protein
MRRVRDQLFAVDHPDRLAVDHRSDLAARDCVSPQDSSGNQGFRVAADG